ncbi:hypothetical protein KHQ82_07405 [Mycoplasmatota bacterium]|nr:hypothetical protein KHQ82_07405 [Mycoplasmatota bacterium]
MKLIDELKTQGINVTNISRINNDIYILSDNNNQYVLKKVNDNGIYEFLFSQGVTSVIYPLSINNSNKIVIRNFDYYLFNYEKEIKYPAKKKVHDLASAIQNIHFSTTSKYKVKPENAIPRFKKMYLFLNYQFDRIDNFMRVFETKELYSDIDYMVLNRYHIMIDLKYYMSRLQMKILDYLEKGLEPILCLNHGNPRIDHLINKKLISFNHARLSVPVYDIALFYINSAHINVDFASLINNWLDKFDNDFYRLYFKFLVIYIYIFSINVSDFNNYSNFINICNKIEMFIEVFLLKTDNTNENQQ